VHATHENRQVPLMSVLGLAVRNLSKRKRVDGFSVFVLHTHRPSRPGLPPHPAAFEHQLSRNAQGVNYCGLFAGEHSSIRIGEALSVVNVKIVSGHGDYSLVQQSLTEDIVPKLYCGLSGV
jgi:hypothetical protein